MMLHDERVAAREILRLAEQAQLAVFENGFSLTLRSRNCALGLAMLAAPAQPTKNIPPKIVASGAIK
jgi:hypothetical protein